MADDFEQKVAPFRRELKAHCYRMSGSLHDAEDLLQEALIRAWKAYAAFEGRSSLRTWLYKITTNVCLDALEKKKSGRQLPSDLGPPNGEMQPPRDEPIWLEPWPDARIESRETVALAFLTALQRLPPKQRAVLILRDVVGLEATECAELLDTSVVGINSALQRAREGIESPAEESPADESLLAKYIQAWEKADVGALVALLREDAILQMPPLPVWITGARAIGESIAGMVFTPGKKFRLVPTRANGLPAFLAFEGDQPMAIHVLDVQGGKIAGITAFIMPRLFAEFQPSP